MVTGKRLFKGEDAAVLQEPVERCLRKDPRKRWYSMEDVQFALQNPDREGGEEVPKAPPLPHGRGSVWVAAVVHFREKPPAILVRRYAMLLPATGPFIRELRRIFENPRASRGFLSSRKLLRSMTARI